MSQNTTGTIVCGIKLKFQEKRFVRLDIFVKKIQNIKIKKGFFQLLQE